jgi:hypothetical protein
MSRWENGVATPTILPICPGPCDKHYTLSCVRSLITSSIRNKARNVSSSCGGRFIARPRVVACLQHSYCEKEQESININHCGGLKSTMPCTLGPLESDTSSIK